MTQTPPPPAPSSGAPTEPILTRGIWTVVATLVVDAIIGFGLPIEGDLKLQLITLISLAGPTVLAFLARAKAWSPDSVRKLADEIEASVVSRYETNGYDTLDDDRLDLGGYNPPLTSNPNPVRPSPTPREEPPTEQLRFDLTDPDHGSKS